MSKGFSDKFHTDTHHSTFLPQRGERSIQPNQLTSWADGEKVVEEQRIQPPKALLHYEVPEHCQVASRPEVPQATRECVQGKEPVLDGCLLHGALSRRYRRLRTKGHGANRGPGPPASRCGVHKCRPKALGDLVKDDGALKADQLRNQGFRCPSGAWYGATLKCGL